MLSRAGLKLGMPSGHGVQSVAVWLLPGLLLHTTCAGCNKFTGMATGQPPCRSAQEVTQQFGTNFPVLDMPVGGAVNPSEIRDIFTNQVFRQG